MGEHWMTKRQTKVLLLILLSAHLHSAAVKEITVCIIEQEADSTSWKEEEVQESLKSRLALFEVHVTLVRTVAPEAQFMGFVMNACDLLNSSCSGLVTFAPCHQTLFLDNWADVHNILHVGVTKADCAVTSEGSSGGANTQTSEYRLFPDLLAHMDWSQVAILVEPDTMGAAFTARLVRHLSDVYIGSVILPVFDHPALSAPYDTFQARVTVREKLHSVASSLFYNILLIATYDTVRLMLQEAATEGLLSRSHFWVILLSDEGCVDLTNQLPGNHTNILVVRPQPPDTSVPDPCGSVLSTCSQTGSRQSQAEVLAITLGIEALVKTILNATTDGTPYEPTNTSTDSICKKNSTSSQNPSAQLTRTIVVEDLLFADILSSFSAANYSICSTEEKSTSGLVSVASWTLQAGLEVAAEPLYRNTFRDFGNKVVRVATREAEPFVRKTKTNGTTTAYSGFCIDILQELATVLKFRCEFVEPRDQEWGAPDKNGSWTGVIGMVLTGEADIAIGPLSITSAREAVVDFTKPFMEDGLGILTRRVDPDAQSMFKMFTPLRPPVWGALVAAVAVASLSLYVIERSSPYSSRNMHGDDSLGLLGSFWLIYGSYVEQGGDPHPRSVSARCLVGFWWLFTILMSSTYTANLAAFLTVAIDGSPINSLTDLAESSTLKPLVKQGSNVYTLFQKSDNGVYREVWEKMNAMPVVKTNTEAEKYVLEGKYAFITDTSQLEYLMLRNCDSYALAKEIFNTGGFGFVVPEDAPYLDLLNYNIMKMQEAGLMDKWRQLWWASHTTCSTASRTSEAKELDLHSLSGIFYIFLAVTLVSVLMKLLEIVFANPKVSQVWNHLKFAFFKPPAQGSSSAAAGEVHANGWVDVETANKLNNAVDKSDNVDSDRRLAHDHGKHIKLNKVRDTGNFDYAKTSYVRENNNLLCVETDIN